MSAAKLTAPEKKFLSDLDTGFVAAQAGQYGRGFWVMLRKLDEKGAIRLVPDKEFEGQPSWRVERLVP